MIHVLGGHLRRWRRRLSRSDWLARHVFPDEYRSGPRDGRRPGVLLIQIDGLSHGQLLRAIDKKRLPFLHRLVQREHFVLKKMYSGQPSTTPAVQAELFFGRKGAVPAFSYYDRKNKQTRAMYETRWVARVAAQLKQRQEGLLKDGSSYSNIFAGGAKEAHFCIQSMELESIFRSLKLRNLLWFVFLHLDHLLRIAGLSLLEAGIALYDCLKGFFTGWDPAKEVKFIFSRIGTCIVMRELIRLHVKIDIARGLPIIHANFIGYDEHSHRRGPSSAFAFWTLKGIDATIKDLVGKALRADSRDYHVFIYSDHGQEAVVPFAKLRGKTIDEALRSVFAHGPLRNNTVAEPPGPLAGTARNWRNRQLLGRTRGKNVTTPWRRKGSGRIHYAAMGPLGHIYLPSRLPSDRLLQYARSLVSQAGIPLVLLVIDNEIHYVNESASGRLAEDGENVLGGGHPFRKQVVEDLQSLCRHRDAGDLVISGWRPTGAPLSFPTENGAHGGPGRNETSGFAILPDTLELTDRPHLRPLEMRQQVQSVLADRPRSTPPTPIGRPDYPEVIRVMSYNIHSCIGVDGKLFPQRIARIINRNDPDIVALQEVDRNMARTRREDQARLIGEYLSMEHHFFPLLERDGGGYGLALLSRYPFTRVRRIRLPGIPPVGTSEVRGLIQVRLETGNGDLHVYNTHLSLRSRERVLQMRAIVNDHLDADSTAGEPVIFCGDLNSGKRSPAYGLLADKLLDCQRINQNIGIDPTFVSTYPVLRLDHIFHSRHLMVTRYGVVNDWECRLASDHLPVLAVFRRVPDFAPRFNTPRGESVAEAIGGVIRSRSGPRSLVTPGSCLPQ